MTTTSDTTDEPEETEEPGETDHLDDIEDGCGCAEVWEHLSEQRESGADD